MEGVGRLYNEDQICWGKWRTRANMYEGREVARGVRDLKVRLAQAKRQQMLALLFLDFPDSSLGLPEPRHHQQYLCWLCMNLFSAQPTGMQHCENLPAHVRSSSRLWLRAQIKFASDVSEWCEMW
jgi:hypothetical protein